MPQFIWEGFFSILNVLVPGVVMALFAAYYQNRRKREIQIESKLAINRIDGYEQILSCFYEGQDIHEVSLREEEEAKAILGYFDVETFRYQCPDAFKSEECFDAYYKRLTILQKKYQIYLDDEASQQLNRSVSIYTRIKNWLDAFSDTEHVVDLKVEKSVARKHIDWMYRLVGMMMFSHCTRAYTELDTVVCKQMNRFYLTYRKHRLRKWPNPINVFFHSGDDQAISRISDMLESVIEDLSNTRDKVILNAMNTYPILATHAHTRPFRRKWLNIITGLVIPAGIFFYIRMLRFRLRLYRDLKVITKANQTITKKIETTLINNKV